MGTDPLSFWPFVRAALNKRVSRNAMQSMVWLCVVVPPTCFGAAYGFRDQGWLSSILIVLGAVPILSACGMFVYFGVVKPQYLQTEEFQIQHQTLEIVSQKVPKVTVERLHVLGDVLSTAQRQLGSGVDKGTDSENDQDAP